MATKKTAPALPATEYVSLSEAARMIGVSPSSVSYYVKQEKLATVDVAGNRVLIKGDVEPFAKEKAESAPAAHSSVLRAVERDRALTDEQREAIRTVLDPAIG